MPMRVQCENCASTYTLPDSRLTPGRRVQFACRHCQHRIVVAIPDLKTSNYTAAAQEAIAHVALVAARAQPPRPMATAVAWFVAGEDSQQNRMTEAGLAAAIAMGTVGPDTLVWRKGYAEWRRAGETEEWAARLAGLPAAGQSPPAADTAAAQAEALPVQAAPLAAKAASASQVASPGAQPATARASTSPVAADRARITSPRAARESTALPAAAPPSAQDWTDTAATVATAAYPHLPSTAAEAYATAARHPDIPMPTGALAEPLDAQVVPASAVPAAASPTHANGAGVELAGTGADVAGATANPAGATGELSPAAQIAGVAAVLRGAGVQADHSQVAVAMSVIRIPLAENDEAQAPQPKRRLEPRRDSGLQRARPESGATSVGSPAVQEGVPGGAADRSATRWSPATDTYTGPRGGNATRRVPEEQRQALLAETQETAQRALAEEAQTRTWRLLAMGAGGVAVAALLALAVVVIQWRIAAGELTACRTPPAAQAHNP